MRGGEQGILAWIVLGLIVGLLARWIVPGASPGGVVADIVVGVLGAAVGGSVYALLQRASIANVNVASMVCALIGAAVLLRILHAFGDEPAL